MVGQLKFIALGAMFSGKSTYLIHEINRSVLAGRSCLIIKYDNDNRYDEWTLSTHDLHKPNKSPTTKTHKCTELVPSVTAEILDGVDVIAIDEAQFFVDIYEFVTAAVMKFDKTVIMASLDAWHTMEPCLSVIRLIPYANHVVKLMAVCSNCKSENATCTYRDCRSQCTQDDPDLIEIGGAEMYSPLCLSCYTKATKK